MNKTRLFIVGDSTVANYDSSYYPQCGWGQVLGEFFYDDIQIINKAVPGRSSKSFINECRLSEIKGEIQQNDYLLIQFGHNDEKDDSERHTDPFSSFKSNLEQFIHVAKEKGAFPILITPVERRCFDKNGMVKDSHGDYLIAMRQLAHDSHAPLVDLAFSSARLYQQLGPEKSKALFLWIKKGLYSNFPNGCEDNTHFSEYGARKIAELVAQGLKKTSLESKIKMG